jgi:hypothetical protein
MQPSSGDVAPLLNARQSHEIRALLRRLAAQCEAGDFAESDVFGYYGGMLSALSEDDFRWGASPFVDRRKLRRERFSQYRRYRELFELEVRLIRERERCRMTRSADWSSMAAHMREAAGTAKAFALLRLAGIWFKLGIPGARDICDAAAFGLFSASYLVA